MAGAERVVVVRMGNHERNQVEHISHFYKYSNIL